MATAIPSNRATFTFDEVAAATRGHLLAGAGSATAVGVAIDSRAVARGGVFIALRGERHDGHAYLQDVVRRGVALIVVEPGHRVPEGVGVIEVGDTRRALADLARAHRRRWAKTIVAITGSVGKTGTKELTALALEGAGVRALATHGNLNNEIGVPMTLLQLDAACDVGVIEIGTSAHGEIARLTEIAEPNLGVVTAVALSHARDLGTLDAIADEKTALFRGLPEDGVALCNADEPRLEARLHGLRVKRIVRVGRAAAADVRIGSVVVEESAQTSVVIAWKGASEQRLRFALLGEAPARGAALALAIVAEVCGTAAVPRAAVALARAAPAPGRLQARVLDSGVLLLDDTYNANPASVRHALDTAAELAAVRHGRVIAVLGDMRELGVDSAREHELVGRHVVAIGASALIGLGEEVRALEQAARDATGRVPPTTVRHVDAHEDAARLARAFASENDVIVVKGSRSMTMELVVEALRRAGGGAT